MTHHTSTNRHAGTRAEQLRAAARQGRTVQGLRMDVDGRLTPIEVRGRETHALRAPLGIAQHAPGGVVVKGLDEDLVLWCDQYGAEHQPVNPVASVVLAAFGRVGEQVFGPVVFTGWSDTGGVLGGRSVDISAAATILLAGMAASCDTPWVGTDRPAEWTGLGVHIETNSGGPESFDALAWTRTRDGDVPRCVECGEPGSHPEHQPEVLAETHEHTALAVGT